VRESKEKREESKIERKYLVVRKKDTLNTTHV